MTTSVCCDLRVDSMWEALYCYILFTCDLLKNTQEEHFVSAVLGSTAEYFIDYYPGS